MAINWDFISDLEGGLALVGYVPAAETSDSGVTIATGFDLGQRSENSIDGMDIAASLKTKLKPYAGLKKQAAVDFLAQHPLTISEDEAKSLDKLSKQGTVDDVARRYDEAVANNPQLSAFDGLSDQAQTVICSVAFQYGSNLKQRAPNFWGACTQARWDDMLAELRNFGDAYPKRRNKEAALLEGGPEIAGF